LDIKRAKRLLANPASTRQELEQLSKEALAADKRELAFDIRAAISLKLLVRPIVWYFLVG
jgi:hypothetical protein